MGKKLYVGNLSYSVNEQDLADLFSQAGTVESATVVADKFSGQSRGFGFVEMSNDDEAQAAIEQFDGQELKGRAMKISEARPRTAGGGGGDRGGGGGGGGRRGDRRRW
jgi:RNA recognition motif-containing protein